MQTAGGYRANFSTACSSHGALPGRARVRPSSYSAAGRLACRRCRAQGSEGQRESSRSSRFSTGAPDLGELFEAVLHHGQQGAEILVYEK